MLPWVPAGVGASSARRTRAPRAGRRCKHRGRVTAVSSCVPCHLPRLPSCRAVAPSPVAPRHACAVLLPLFCRWTLKACLQTSLGRQPTSRGELPAAREPATCRGLPCWELPMPAPPVSSHPDLHCSCCMLCANGSATALGLQGRPACATAGRAASALRGRHAVPAGSTAHASSSWLSCAPPTNPPSS